MVTSKQLNRILTGGQAMFKRKIMPVITVGLGLALFLSGCDRSTTELVDETISESTVLQTSAETTTTTETATEATSAVTTAITTETTTKATTATTTETTTETTTANTTETTAAPTTTVTTTPTTTEITTNTTTETTTVTTTETTTEATTEDITADLTPEELEIYNSMPDIVFVFSHMYRRTSRDYYSNIRGFYITKNGEIKMYAFSDEEEFKYTDVVEVYDELENVTCSELILRMEGDEVTQDDLDRVPISDLIELYNRLLLVDEKANIKQKESHEDAIQGIYELYGIRKNQNGKKKIILLDGWGDYHAINEDIYAQEISKDIDSYFYY